MSFDTVKHFTHTMAGAPVLSHAPGSLIAVLDACLINGFDLRPALTLTVTAGVATMTFSGISAARPDAVILIAGVTGPLAAINGERRVLTAGSGVLTFATALPNGTATGTINFRMAPLNWLNPFTGTDLRVYRSADPLSTRHFMRVDDTTSLFASVRGFEGMTDVNTGTGPFPNVTQRGGQGAGINKAVNTAVTFPVKWTVVGNGRCFLVNIVGTSNSTSAQFAGRSCFYGDFPAFRPAGDPFAFGVSAGSALSNAVDSSGNVDGGAVTSIFTPRDFHGLGGSDEFSSFTESGSTIISGTDTTGGIFPSTIDGSMRLSRRLFKKAVSAPARGAVPGLFHIAQSQVGTVYDQGVYLGGTGPLTGRRLITFGAGYVSTAFPAANGGISLVDVTGPWA
jgi:hypothetical protein